MHKLSRNSFEDIVKMDLNSANYNDFFNKTSGLEIIKIPFKPLPRVVQQNLDIGLCINITTLINML